MTPTELNKGLIAQKKISVVGEENESPALRHSGKTPDVTQKRARKKKKKTKQNKNKCKGGGGRTGGKTKEIGSGGTTLNKHDRGQQKTTCITAQTNTRVRQATKTTTAGRRGRRRWGENKTKKKEEGDVGREMVFSLSFFFFLWRKRRTPFSQRHVSARAARGREGSPRCRQVYLACCMQCCRLTA